MNFEDIKNFIIAAWDNVFIKFFATTLAFIFCWWLTTVVLKALKKKLLKKGVDRLVVNVIFIFILWGIRILLIIVYASIVGIETAGFAAIISSAGLTLGLALQGSLSNLAGGIVLVVTRPFQLGDYIEVNNEVSGTIENMKLFYSELVTPDNKVIMVPNGTLANGIIINYSRKNIRRVDLVFPVSYKDDIENIISLIKDVCNNHPLILKEPELLVAETDHTNYCINIAVKPWVKTEDYWTVYFDLIKAIHKSFDEHGIVMPVQQVEVINK